MKIKRFEKILLLLSPKLGMKKLAKKMGIKNVLFDKAHELFSNVERLDIIPTQSETRGFIMILDGQTALYFYQNGDHFSYDGYEMGEYDKGDVTIFDHLK